MTLSEKPLEEKEKPTEASLKERCVKCIKGPNLVKTLVVIVCVAVVVQQVTTCISKLVYVPITTYTHFDFNKTLLYPSVTFCREPPYKYNRTNSFGLYAHPRYTSEWRNFDFENISLDYLWEEITYNEKDFFVQYGLDGLKENVSVNETMGFVLGRCFTLDPQIVSSHASKSTGYSITLQHTMEDIATSTSVYPPGYHVYIHYKKEPFSEVEVYNGGLVDYLYVNTGEMVDVRLTVDQYTKISAEDDPCTDEDNYSTNNCTSSFVWDMVGDAVGCSGPWMKSKLAHCDNYSQMRSLITAYLDYVNHKCDVCPRTCRSYLYSAFVTNRQTEYWWDSNVNEWVLRSGDAALQTQLYIYFNSMMVSVYKEQYNYDWNLFLSDIGGSVGFLLGLSVISITTVATKVWSTLLKPFCRSNKSKAEVASIPETLPAAEKGREYEEKCQEWNMRNEIYAKA